MSNIERVYIEDLNVGDKVCVIQHVSSGWKHFRYPIFLQTEVTRITPKKTKLDTKDYGSCDKKRSLFRPNKETERQSLVAKSFQFITSMVFKMSNRGYHVDIENLSDEDIVEVAKLFIEIDKILKKYIKEDLF